MAAQLGHTLRQERERAGWTVEAFAREAKYSVPYIRHIENGTRPATAVIADIYDRILNAGGVLSDLYRAEQDGDEMRRRALLVILGGAAQLGASAPHLAGEMLRADLLGVLGVEDWTYLAAEYGNLFMIDPPERLRVRLARDLLVLRDVLRGGDNAAAERAAPRLILIQGMMLANAGDTEDGARWYRAARLAADQTGDANLRAWTRGREAFRLGYEGADPRSVVHMAEDVEDVEAHLAAAQAYARLNAPTRAREHLETARRLFERGDQSEDTIYAMPPWRWALSAGYVYALLGDVAGSDRLLDQVAPPPRVARWHAQLDMQRAVALARARDTTSALEIQRAVIAQAPHEERSAVLSQMCRVVENCATNS